jgi:hypothetical protein
MLTEVIVSLVILALGLGALFNSVSVGSHASALADQQRAATVAAQSIIAELGRAHAVEDGISEGDLPGGRHWRLTLDKIPTGDAKGRAVLDGHTVALTLTWRQNGRTQALDFHALLLKGQP